MTMGGKVCEWVFHFHFYFRGASQAFTILSLKVGDKAVLPLNAGT